MSQQYVGGIGPGGETRDAGPALGGIIVAPVLSRFSNAVTRPTGVKLPFAASFLVALAFHRTGAATTNRNMDVSGGSNPTIGAEFGSSFDLTMTTNEPAEFSNQNGPTLTFRGNPAVALRVFSSTSGSAFPKDQVDQATIRALNRGDIVRTAAGAAVAAFQHSTQVFLVPRGHVYDRDETHQGATIASGVSEPYNSSKD